MNAPLPSVHRPDRHSGRRLIGPGHGIIYQNMEAMEQRIAELDLLFDDELMLLLLLRRWKTVEPGRRPGSMTKKRATRDDDLGISYG